MINNNTPKNKNRKATVILVVILCACPLLMIGIRKLASMNIDFNFYENIETTPETQAQRIYFEEPDFEFDIMTDESYLEKNRYIEYSTPDGVTTTITDGAYARHGVAVAMFADYFDTLIKGDAETLATFYAEDYLKEHTLPEAITMQRIYDIRITMRNETVDDDGVVRATFKVVYKIMKNDGTFRRDVGSDEALPLLYELTLIDGVPFITNVSNAKFSDLG